MGLEMKLVEIGAVDTIFSFAEREKRTKNTKIT